MTRDRSSQQPLLVLRDHRRDFEHNRYVYAVVSRRSRGVSIGINLNPDKRCNFDCVYCQVERATPPLVTEVDEARLMGELENMLDLVITGELFRMERFQATPPSLRRLNDIAFSGDGEPTTYPRFLEIVGPVTDIWRRRHLDDVKLVVITNATRLHKPKVREALALLDSHRGEIWAKLEAGTEDYYQRVERTSVPFALILENIRQSAKVRPLVIQSLFMRLHGQPPAHAELNALCDRLLEILRAGGQIRLVQIYTVARVPAESYVSPLDDGEVDAIVHLVRERTGLRVEAFYGAG